MIPNNYPKPVTFMTIAGLIIALAAIAMLAMALHTSAHAATTKDPRGVIVCYQHQELLTGGGRWVSSGEGSNVKELFHPDFNTGRHTDGHGLLVLKGGSARGDC